MRGRDMEEPDENTSMETSVEVSEESTVEQIPEESDMQQVSEESTAVIEPEEAFLGQIPGQNSPGKVSAPEMTTHTPEKMIRDNENVPQQDPLQGRIEETSPPTEPNSQPASRLVKVDNWGSFFIQQLHALYLTKTDCDFHLQFHDGHKLQVHRFVLNACTDFFKNSNIEGCNVLLPVEFSYESFNAIVNFIYTGRLEYTDEIFDNLYSIAKVLKMTVLVKLLEAQIQSQENSSLPTSFHSAETKGAPPLFAAKVGKTTKVVKRVSVNGKKSLKIHSPKLPKVLSPKLPKVLSPNLPKTTLPGKKLPIWKKRTKPLAPTPFLTTNGIIKRNILDPATPVRFEWPDNSTEPTTSLDEFQDLSYETKPLLKPNRGELQYLSAEDFDSKVNSVLKRSFTGVQDEPYEKQSRLDGSLDQIYSSDDFIGIDCDRFRKGDSQIITSLHDNDMDSSDDDYDLNEKSSPPDKSNGCDLNVTPYESKPSISANSTPKPILKTGGTPSSLKKVRFSLEEKENAQNIEDENVSSLQSNIAGNMKQTNTFFNTKTGVVDSVSVSDKVVTKSGLGKPFFIEKDVTSIKEGIGAKISMNEKAMSETIVTSSSKNRVLFPSEPEAPKESDTGDVPESKKLLQTLVAASKADPSETLQIETAATVLSVTEMAENIPAPPTPVVIPTNKKVLQNSDASVVKTPAANHARIVSEVLKKYPHLLNKNVRLKIMNQDGDKNSVTNIKINCLPGGKASKNIMPTIGTKKDSGSSVEQAKRLSSKDPCKGPWLCSSCGINGKPRNFESYFLYHKHLLEIHNEKLDSRICAHCGQKFTKRNLLLYHLFTKHNVPPPRNMVFPKCDQCDYIALTESLLIKHRNSNAHQSEFECKVCAMKFKSNGALQGHMQTKLHFHDAPKVYKCLHCSEKFTRNINLKAHIRSAHSKRPPQEGVVGSEQQLDLALREQNSTTGEGECTLILDSSVALVAGVEQVPLLPSSESEALNNVASGIATSIGLNDTLVNGETVILLNEGTEYFLQNTNNHGEYIVPEILSHSDQIYAFQGKDQLEHVSHLANLCPQGPTPVSQLISEDTIVTIDDGTNHYGTQYNVPISITDQVHNRDSNQLILFTLNDSESTQKLCNTNAQSILVTQAGSSLTQTLTPTHSGEHFSPEKLPDAGFNPNVNCEIQPHFEQQVSEAVATVQEQNSGTSISENLSSGGSEVEISNLSIDLDRCDPNSDSLATDSGTTEGTTDGTTEGTSVPPKEQNGEYVPKPKSKRDSMQMEALVQDWDEFSDEDHEEEVEDDRKVSNMPCRPTFPSEADSFPL